MRDRNGVLFANKQLDAQVQTDQSVEGRTSMTSLTRCDGRLCRNSLLFTTAAGILAYVLRNKASFVRNSFSSILSIFSRSASRFTGRKNLFSARFVNTAFGNVGIASWELVCFREEELKLILRGTRSGKL